MKLMIASDLHGSAYYTQALLRRMEDEKPAKLVLLGDIAKGAAAVSIGMVLAGPVGKLTAGIFAMPSRAITTRKRAPPCSTRSKKRRFASAATATGKWTRWY